MAHNVDRDMDFAALDHLLAEARAETLMPPIDLLARIEADAARVQAEFEAPQSRRAQRDRKTWLFDLLGHWALPTGLVAAGLTGLWIGVSAEAVFDYGVGSVYDSSFGLQLIYEYPAIAGLLPEG